jgi:hypothetical protein
MQRLSEQRDVPDQEALTYFTALFGNFGISGETKSKIFLVSEYA